MTTVKCWKCGAMVAAGDLCPSCGELQPFHEKTDHFALFGLPRKLALDLGALEGDFHALSRKFHPDFYQTRGSRARAVSLENSARLNVAYRTLRDPITRVEYLLELEGLPVGTPSNPPAELFEEILELQEARQEYRAKGDPELRDRLQASLRELESRKAALEEELSGLFVEWDRRLDSKGEPGDECRKLLERMRGVLATRAYLRTVLRDLTEDLKGT